MYGVYFKSISCCPQATFAIPNGVNTTQFGMSQVRSNSGNEECVCEVIYKNLGSPPMPRFERERGVPNSRDNEIRSHAVGIYDKGDVLVGLHLVHNLDCLGKIIGN